MFRQFFLMIFLSCGFIGSTHSAELLNFSANDTVEYHLREEFQLESGFSLPLSEVSIKHKAETELWMEVTVLDPFSLEVEVVIRGFAWECGLEFYNTRDPQDQHFATQYIRENLLNQAFIFRVADAYKATELTGNLYDVTISDPSESLQELSILFNHFLGSMFHLKEIELEAHQNIEYPILPWLDFVFCSPSLENVHAETECNCYTIDSVNNNSIRGTLDGVYKGLIDSSYTDISINGNVEWDQENALVQQRHTKVKIVQSGVFSSVNLDLDQKWESKPL